MSIESKSPVVDELPTFAPSGAAGRKSEQDNPSPMSARRILFWIHLSAGTIAGLVILVMSVTGILLGYERQITDWFDNKYVSSAPTQTNLVPIDVLVSRAREAKGKPPTLIRIKRDPGAPIEFGFGPDEDTLLLDRNTGESLKKSDDKVRRFFVAVEHWHRWLGTGTEYRDWGRNVTGVCNLAFFVLVVSGPFLWWPKKFSWLRAKRNLMFQRNLTRRVRNFNWHNVAGIWCFLPLLLIVLTGAVMSYTWANNLLYRMAGDVPPRQVRPEGTARDGRKGETKNDQHPNFEVLFARAQQQVPEWERISLRLPQNNSAMTFTIEVGNGGRPDRRSQLTLDGGTAAVIRWEPFSSYSLGRRLRAWARFTHTGEAGGWFGQTIAVFASCGATLLVWTGLSLVLARFRAWRRVRSQIT